MRKIAVFNHKGGVGKTTLTVNLADAFASMGRKVLLVDADPQCNLSAFCIAEKELDQLLGAGDMHEREHREVDSSATATPDNGDGAEAIETSDDDDIEEGSEDEVDGIDDESGETIWTGIRPVVRGRGSTSTITPWQVQERVLLAVGDVLLSLYEEELPAAWTDSFARKSRGYDVMCALPTLVNQLAEKHGVDTVLYDVGPNVGPLNRTVLLDSDFFVTPVASDLFSLRALTTVGQAIARWVRDWETVRSIASKGEKARLMRGRPTFLGYIISAYKVRMAGQAAEAHLRWERKIAPRVRSKVAEAMGEVGTDLVCPAPWKLGQVKHYQSLAAHAQDLGSPFARLTGQVNSGYNGEIASAARTFASIAERILQRMETHDPER